MDEVKRNRIATRVARSVSAFWADKGVKSPYGPDYSPELVRDMYEGYKGEHDIKLKGLAPDDPLPTRMSIDDFAWNLADETFQEPRDRFLHPDHPDNPGFKPEHSDRHPENLPQPHQPGEGQAQ